MQLPCIYKICKWFLLKSKATKELKRSYTLNIRHGLKINILVNKYSENIFPFMKCVCYTGTEIYTDWFVAFKKKTFVMVLTENNYLKKLKNINFVHFNLKC